jgi:hypothetical protein
MARPERGYPLLAGWACRRDDLGAAQRGQGDEQSAGDPAGSVDEELLTGADVERVAENLLGGECGHREGGRGLPAGTLRFSGEQPGRGDQPGRPGPLVSQRHRMGHDRIAGRPVTDRPASRHHPAGCLHAQRHRRPGTHVPAAGADELIPVAHAGHHHLEQHLVVRQRPRLTHLDNPDPVTDPANPRYLHLSPPEAARGRRRPGMPRSVFVPLSVPSSVYACLTCRRAGGGTGRSAG